MSMDAIAAAHQQAEAARATYLEAVQARDALIREAIAGGVTMYAIAQRLGISRTAVAKIRDRA